MVRQLCIRTANQLLKTFNSPNILVDSQCTPLLAHIPHSFSHLRFYTRRENIQELLNNAATFEHADGSDSAWSTSPYPKGVINPRAQSRHALRPKIDPRDTSIILFPGEGSQYVGMGKKLLKNRDIVDLFDAANDILKYDLLSLCLGGPKEKLDEMKHAQVAVMVFSFAALQNLKDERPNSVDSCIATGGFGIGELTALTFAGALSFERAVRLAQLRGEAMQVASEMVPSGMMTVLYKPSTKLHSVLTKAVEYAAAEGVEEPFCEVAQYLFPHCKVIAGHTKCLEFIERNFKNLDLQQVRRLNIQGASHTQLMKPAADTFRKYLMKSNLRDPEIAVHSNVDGKIYHNSEFIIKKLSSQIVKPLRWEQMMHILYERPQGEGFPTTFECGPGSTLRTLLKMTNAKAYDHCVSVFDQPVIKHNFYTN